MCHRFKVCTGELFLSGFIGDNNSKRDWMKERTQTWERKIHTISKSVGKHHQESYDVVVRVIQLEWIFIQHIMKNMGDAFAGVEKILWENFLPCLLPGK